MTPQAFDAASRNATENATEASAAIEPPVPPLREDLRLNETPLTSRHGEPTWVIEDTVLNRFYRIGWLEFECLARWGQTASAIQQQISAETALRPGLEQIHAFIQFLARNQLLRLEPGRTPLPAASATGFAWLTWRWWLHHYLFFRIPLVRPQRWLKRLTSRLDWLFHPATGIAVLLLSLLGIVRVLHQWDTFRAAVVESFSPEGLFSFALAVIAAKTLHELAHALVATRLGVRVAHMGIAFVVLWPMLYTDTGESWKLLRSRQRLAISAAGIVCELALAGLATLGWVLTEPGALRNGLLYLATTSWVLSLGLNASPFMRFDGYFILSDLLDMPNLHERAFAQARVWLRRTLAGLDETPPEVFTPLKRRLLIAFALVTLLYRLVLFLGIAVTVYFLFFKLLGVALFIVEVTWFIALPVWRELNYVWAQRAHFPPSRRRLFGLAGAVLALLLAVPWHAQVHAVGVARAEHLLHLYAPFPARLQTLHPMGQVAAGTTLSVLDEPDLALRVRGHEAELRGYEGRLSGLLADNAGLEHDAATQAQVSVQSKEIQATRAEIARLSLQAPFSGRWLDVDPERHAGQWVGRTEPLGMLVDPQHWLADAYVRQDDMQWLKRGASVRFYPEAQMQAIHGTVIALGSTAVRHLAYPMLASRYQGPVMVAPEHDALIPNPPVFHVVVRLDHAPAALRETRGELQIEGQRRSMLGLGLQHLSAALLRESGF
ncbi:HlyD family efflux transporter periplasmic adaptor subunit [Paraburkholderia hayleyella]|uniref:HlyD family efflux transporter periplasmic adaptor subunit n=1 Tax=Paraburkholderia hayleyella TaxID=2152889 RepID=UPI001FE2F32F|nr:HlyD family efflux transporter periplasmic adaptor subunit [Paraburkholderia hayleyella]